VLGFEDARCKHLLRITLPDPHAGLDDNRARIHPFIDEVHRAAGYFNPTGKRLPLCMETGKGREQGRVDVDDPSP